MYPQVEINLGAIRENTRKIVKLGESRGFDIVGVTKGVCGDPEIAKAMIDSGINILGDSRISNIMKMRNAGIHAEYMLIREPMLSEAEKVVKYADYSLNAEIETLKKLSQWAKKYNKIHKVIIMVDVGDRREGLLPSQVEIFLEKAKNLSGIKISGLGTNMVCFAGVLPTYKNQQKLVDVAKRAKKILGHEIEIISTGGTEVLTLVEKNILPKGINQIRVGEAILLGTMGTFNRIIEFLRQDTFILKAEVIEIKKKPSMPEGPRGLNALGKKISIEDKGIQKRVIIALGVQDTEIDGLVELSSSATILGGSSDHIILDVGNLDVSIGDIISFRLKLPSNYWAMLKAMTSPYVEKKYKK